MHNKLIYKNIIKVRKDEISLEESDGNIVVTLSDKFDFYDIEKMDIQVKKDTSLFLLFEGKKETKIDISYTIEQNVTFHLFEQRKKSSYKIQEKFYIEESAFVEVEKLNEAEHLKELNIAYLKGTSAQIWMKQVGIFLEKSKVDLLMYHAAPKTKSHLINRFVTKNAGTLSLTTTAMVYKGMKKSIVNQDNKIVSANDCKSKIQPNLLIEEYDVEANHSANVEPYPKDAIFYMQTRGLTEIEAKRLLLKGFLNNRVIDSEKLVKKYWR